MGKKTQPRQTKTHAQRAQEALDLADRHVDRLTKRSDQLVAELTAVNHELEAATTRRDYLSQHPDLAKAETE